MGRCCQAEFISVHLEQQHSNSGDVVGGINYVRIRLFVVSVDLTVAGLTAGSTQHYEWRVSTMSRILVSEKEHSVSSISKLQPNKFTLNWIDFWPSEGVFDISDAAFFNITWYFLWENGRIFSPLTDVSLSLEGDSWGDLKKSVDALAKSFYSTVLADLGMTSGPNILTDDEVLRKFTSNYSNLNAATGWVPAGPATGSYGSSQPVTGKPTINSSSIFNTYLCQIPVQKVPASLIVSVLLANLVFLRALWSMVSLVSSHVAEKQDPRGTIIPKEGFESC